MLRIPPWFRLVLGATVLAVALSTTGAPAFGQPANTLAPRAPALLDTSFPEFGLIVDAYLRSYPGLSREDAVRAAQLSPRRFGLVKQLATEHSTGFGGAWYDPSTNTLHMNIVDDPAEQAAEQVGGAWGLAVATTRVRYSLETLQQISDDIKYGVTHVPGKRWAAVDVTANAVQVGVEPARLREAADTFGLAGPDRTLRADGTAAPVRLTAALPASDAHEEACTDRFHCGRPARSGVSLWTGAEGNDICSTGFTARTHASPVSYWIVTAGHCSAGINARYGHGEQFFGPLRSATNVAGLDVARIRKDNTYWTTGGHMYSDTGTAHVVRVDNVAPARGWILQGEGVCLTARGGAICGVIENVADPVSEGLMRVRNADGCPGDSGGGWYWPGGATFGRVAYGIHEGQPRNQASSCHAAGAGSVFTAVPDIVTHWDRQDAVGANLRFESRCPNLNSVCNYS
jgi:streptogrisin C